MSRQKIIGDWLIYLANPIDAPMPAALPDATAEAELLRQSDLHGVLPLFLRRFPFAGAASHALKTDGRDRNRVNQLMTALLRYHSNTVMADAGGLAATIVKGPVFAETIYPDPSLRGYTDIDILAAPEAVPQLAAILEAHAFRLIESITDGARKEWKWIHRVNQKVMIEVQTDLVHSPAIRKAVSLRYEDIAAAPAGPAALLLVALIHAGAAHQYDRLQLAVDICRAANVMQAPDDERCFGLMIERTGARLLAVIGLELSGRLFEDRRCLQLATALKPARYSGIAERLLNKMVVTSTMSNRRALYSWRRQIVRELIKRG